MTTFEIIYYTIVSVGIAYGILGSVLHTHDLRKNRRP